MVIRIKHITLILTLLLLGGITNGAWADVTYHILTLPFTTKKTDGTNYQTDIRVEALRVVVKATDNGGKVGLPDKFKSPLLKDAAYQYYSSATVTQKVQIYKNNATNLILAHRGQERCVTDQNSTSHGDRHAVRFLRNTAWMTVPSPR